MKLLYLDVETTGTDPKKNGIIQISGIIEIDGEEKETFDFPVQPFESDVIEQSALDVNKVERAFLQELPSAATVYGQLIALLSKYVDRFNKRDKFVVVGYNAAFDTQFLREWFAKNGDKYYGSWFWHPYVDVMTLTMAFNLDSRPTLPDFKLITVAKFLGFAIDEAGLHNALYDVLLTKLIYRKVRAQGGQL